MRGLQLLLLRGGGLLGARSRIARCVRRSCESAHRAWACVVGERLAWACLLVIAGCGAPTSALPGLTLEEVAYDRLPDGFRSTGIAAASEEQLLIWSRTAGYSLLQRGSKWIRLNSSSRIAGACFVGGGVDLLDTTGTARRFDRDGKRITERAIRLPEGDSLLSATCTGSKWYALGSSGAILGGQMSSAAPLDFLGVSWIDLLGVESHVHLGVAVDGQLLLTSSFPPFTTARLDPTSLRAITFEAVALADLPTEVLTGQGFWRSLPTVAVGAHYLRTLVDGQTDNRLLILHDQSGSVLRSIAVRAPMGVVATAGEQLIGIRYADGEEMVRYRWRMSTNNLSD